MYIAVTGSKNNKDVYIYQFFRKTDGKSSSRIYKKLGKYNALLEQFDGDADKLMAWAKNEADQGKQFIKSWNIAHIAAKPKTATAPDFTGVVAVFYFQTVKDGIIYANSTISQVYECKKCKAELLQIR